MTLAATEPCLPALPATSEPQRFRSEISGEQTFMQRTIAVAAFDPLTDPRWPKLLAQHPHAGIFHTREWLQALHFTYGYQPVAFTTCARETLTNAVVFCEVHSRLTGRRLVSLPFSDHCQPLAHGHELAAILEHLATQQNVSRWRYIELRPTDISAPCAPFSPSESFALQTIDLRPSIDVIYSRFHNSCIRRKIKRAEREDLLYEAGRSEELLKKFRTLLFLTRRRHRLPPQPASWFRNIVRFLGDAVTIHMLSKDGVPVASLVTLRHKNVLTYKYGCSDATFNNFGGTPLLFWQVIRQAKSAGVESFDLGRSSPEDPGLIAFKEHLGALSSELLYSRSPSREPAIRSSLIEARAWARQTLVRLPDPLFAGVGQLVYRHLG